MTGLNTQYEQCRTPQIMAQASQAKKATKEVGSNTRAILADQCPLQIQPIPSSTRGGNALPCQTLPDYPQKRQCEPLTIRYHVEECTRINKKIK